MTIAAEALLSEIEKGRTNFSGADMRGARLDGINIDGHDLLFSNVDFEGASLKGVTFSRTNFAGSRFVGAELTGATFDRCTLIGCDFFRALCAKTKFFGGTLEDSCLVQTDFTEAIFGGTSFENALIGWTKFNGSRLGMIRDLQKVQYAKLSADTPPEVREALPTGDITSFIDMATIENTAEVYRLVYTRPDPEAPPAEVLTPPDVFTAFLSRNGVGAHFVEAFARMISERQTKFESVFISYSTRDQEFADFLYGQLQSAGVKAWYAPRDIEGGKTILEQVKSAIHTHDRLILILSNNSLRSGWVSNELRIAFNREREGRRRVLFPIRIVSFDELQRWELHDADTGIDLAHHVRSYFVPDFSDWKGGKAIGQEIQRLVKALQKKDL
jgi:hypothetical protein